MFYPSFPAAIKATLFAGLLGSTNAFWRMPCRGRTGVARIDPLVNPNAVAAHAHSIHGSSGMSCLSCTRARSLPCAVSLCWNPGLALARDWCSALQNETDGTLTLIPGFGISSTYDDLMNGDCTSCQVTQDKSVYWHPSVYFKGEDGTFTLVGQTGGMLV